MQHAPQATTTKRTAHLEVVVLGALLGQLPEQGLVAEAAPVPLRQVEHLEPFPVLHTHPRRHGVKHGGEPVVVRDIVGLHTSARSFSSLAFSSPASYLMTEKMTVGYARTREQNMRDVRSGCCCCCSCCSWACCWCCCCCCPWPAAAAAARAAAAAAATGPRFSSCTSQWRITALCSFTRSMVYRNCGGTRTVGAAAPCSLRPTMSTTAVMELA